MTPRLDRRPIESGSAAAANARRCADPRCNRGWLGEDLDGRLIPCLQCKPHIHRAAPVDNDCGHR